MTRLDKQVRELAEAKGFRVTRPWEIPPWEVVCGPCPYSSGAEYWDAAVRFRRQLIAELRAERP